MSRQHPTTPVGSRGQATPLVAIALLLAALLLVPLSLLGALAGALAGEGEARSIAAANGARLESYERRGAVVEVVVTVGGRRATARAERSTVVRPAPPVRAP